MLFFLLLMLLFHSICHQVSNQADKLALLVIFIISRRFVYLNRWAKRRLIIEIAKRANLSAWLRFMLEKSKTWHVCMILWERLDLEKFWHL